MTSQGRYSSVITTITNDCDDGNDCDDSKDSDDIDCDECNYSDNDNDCDDGNGSDVRNDVVDCNYRTDGNARNYDNEGND